jgi:hypothetical protein
MRRVTRTVSSAAKQIKAANAKYKVYDAEALEVTLAKRLYWVRHPMRCLAAAGIRGMAALLFDSEKISGLAEYLEQRGFSLTIRRCAAIMLRKEEVS